LPGLQSIFNLQPKGGCSLATHPTFMKVGRKPKPESPEEMALVHDALKNPIRRRMFVLMVDGSFSIQEIAEAVGPKMLD